MLEKLAGILQQTGALLLDRRASGRFTYQRKDVSVSASVDTEAHNCLAQSLSSLCPGVPVLSEEDEAARSAERPEKYWLIDPLDGTASFVDGYAGFVTQAALMQNCRPVLACVFAPALSEIFLAEAGAGATRNGARLGIQARAAAQRVLIDNYPSPRGIAADLMRDWSINRYLECGSIGLKICRVADGSADIFIKDVTVRDWDVAAPQLVLEEAGGALSDVIGQPIPYAGAFERRGLIACASDGTTAQILEWLQQREIQ